MFTLESDYSHITHDLKSLRIIEREKISHICFAKLLDGTWFTKRLLAKMISLPVGIQYSW